MCEGKPPKEWQELLWGRRALCQANEGEGDLTWGRGPHRGAQHPAVGQEDAEMTIFNFFFSTSLWSGPALLADGARPIRAAPGPGFHTRNAAPRARFALRKDLCRVVGLQVTD